MRLLALSRASCYQIACMKADARDPTLTDFESQFLTLFVRSNHDYYNLRVHDASALWEV
jgi:hypothetical protein